MVIDQYIVAAAAAVQNAGRLGSHLEHQAQLGKNHTETQLLHENPPLRAMMGLHCLLQCRHVSGMFSGPNRKNSPVVI